MKTGNSRDKKAVIIWLLVGALMVFVQILLGGITRLTGSGLSITRWDIIVGTFPPLNAAAWQHAFELYQATPQYQKINQGMTMSQFQFIYFWEYFHRLWARLMGLVFLIPFLYFLFRGFISGDTIRRLFWVIILAGMAAVFGWIMVASGLQDRPWVNAYKLTIHLSLGIALFILLVYTWLKSRGLNYHIVSSGWRKGLGLILILAIVQVCFGGMVSGMKSAMLYPTWPSMQGEWVPAILLDGSHWNTNNFLLYDSSGFMPALAQFIHRNLAYLLLVLAIIMGVKWIRTQPRKYSWMVGVLLGIIVVQSILGILTLLQSFGSIPVLWGVLHQGTGILFITYLFYLNWIWKTNK